MDFLILTDWKGDSYESIFVIVNRLTRMVHYEPVKITINAPSLAEVIINILVRHHGLLNSIITDRGFFFTSKFWSPLCYFLGLKRRLSTSFHLQMDDQIKRQNSTIEIYLQAFVIFEQNDWARLFSMGEFAYNNAKKASTNHTSFELNSKYHSYIFYEKDLNPCSKLKIAEKLSSKLQNLMAVCQ